MKRVVYFQKQSYETSMLQIQNFCAFYTKLCLEHCLRTYYVLTRYFYNENKVLYKESIIFSKTKVLKR